MTWTRINHENIWNLAKSRYEEDPRRKYHNWDHVCRLYHHAEFTFGFEYDEQLDRAILGHDVIYDEYPLKENRSATWLLHKDPKATSASYVHIMRTAKHQPGCDNRIILLDLADFMDSNTTIENRDLLEKEAEELYGINKIGFAKANVSFLENLLASYSPENLQNLPEPEQYAFLKITEGIRFSINLSKSIIKAHRN